VTPVFACLPVLMFFSALALLATLVVVLGAYHKGAPPEEPRPKREFTWQWGIAILITIVVPVLMFLLIWISPDW